MSDYQEKCSALLDAIHQYTKQDIMIAFSGGVDSSLLLKLACESAKAQQKKVYAVTVHTFLHPVYEIDISKKVAKEAGAIHSVIQVNELMEAGIMNNPPDRCYLCKKFIFTQLKRMAEEKQIEIILDGTNEDDLHSYRPGIRALRELEIISPLADAHMTKAEIRKLAAEYGISVSERPSAPCLATRFPYHTLLSAENMQKVEKGESYIRALSFYNVRIRVHDDIARIEVDHQDIPKLMIYREEIVSYLKSLGYHYVTVDLEGFCSGSMDYRIIPEERNF